MTDGERIAPTTPTRGVLRRLGYLLAAQWVRDAVQAVFLLLLARRSTELFGNFTLALGLGQILLFTTEFGINQHFTVLLAKGRVSPGAVFRQISAIKAGLLGLGIMGLAGFTAWQGYGPDLWPVVLVVAVSFGLDSLVNSYFVVCQVLGRQDVEGRLRGAAALVGYGWGLAALLLGAGPLAIALFKPVETAVGLIWVTRLLLKRRLRGTSWGLRTLWENWREGIVFTIMAVAAILYNKINIFFLQNSGGAEAVAQYGATWQLVDGVSVLVSSLLLGKVLFPLLARLWGRDRAEFLAAARTQAAILAAASLPALFVLALESGRIIGLLYGPAYAEAARVQPALTLCILFAFLHNLAYYLLLSMGRQRLLAVYFLAGLALNAALCSWAIPRWGLDGAVWSMILTKGFMALLTLGACQRLLRLLSLRALLPPLLAAAAAWGLAWGGRTLDLALPGEIAGLALLLLLLWRTCRRTPAKESPACG